MRVEGLNEEGRWEEGGGGYPRVGCRLKLTIFVGKSQLIFCRLSVIIAFSICR